MADAAVIQFPVRDGAASRVNDSYVNFAAQVGIGTDNVASFGTYAFTFLTRNRILLEALYRGSWIIGAAIDSVADDMTQAGIELQTDMSPDDIELLNEAIDDLQVWEKINEVIKWGRLYGSCTGVYLVDGQDFATPLDVSTVRKGQFRGILPMDRWQLIPSIGRLVQELGPDMGMPEYYTTVPDAILPDLGPIHHTRLFRYDSIQLPHYQKMTENLWSESIVERVYDRLLAFDSTTEGVAQLVFKAHLRTLSMENLRNVIAAGGPAMNGVIQNVAMIRRFQTNEGLTLLDSKDKLETHTYTFAGLDDILLRFAEQICGATESNMSRMFGQETGGLNSSGEVPLRNYYDGITKKQKTRLRRPLKTILALASHSTFGKPLPAGFNFKFNPLWQITDKEKSEIAAADTTAVTGAYTDGVVPRSVALKELKQSGQTTGMWTNITEKDIADADAEPPLSEFAQTPEEIAAMANPEGEDGKDKPAE